MTLKNLPLGISTLSLLLESNGIYVDKTEYAYHLIKQPGRFFLSRPRRFGKSLFVDTLKEIFEGNQKLFEGLFIYLFIYLFMISGTGLKNILLSKLILQKVY
jgi:hypothetical protein